MKEERRKENRIPAIQILTVVVIDALILAAAVKDNDGGRREERQEAVTDNVDISSYTVTGAAEQEPEKEFEDWVKPHVEGMVPVYGRTDIDYISLDDFELMGKTVFAEAKAEEFEGQIAVAEVILNRVESENFPDTVAEVIKQEGAFSSWGNGFVKTAPLDDECLEAVQEAINGRNFPDAVVYFREGCFHSYGTPYTVIGNHYFSIEEEKDR